MNKPDAFEDLARYYDPLMTHVNYDRWFAICLALGDMTGATPPRHLDAACGTGTLTALLQKAGWDSVGCDLSRAMVHESRRKRGAWPAAVADLRALPFRNGFDLVTSLFDSLNFLLEEEQLAEAFAQLHSALDDGGLLYADIITERMVTDHFEGREWVEQNDGFQSRWASSYDKAKAVAESRVQVNTGRVSSIRERVYPLEQVKQMVEAAGFQLLAAYDADGWKPPRKKTTRVDLIAAKNPPTGMVRQFHKTACQIREMVYGR